MQSYRVVAIGDRVADTVRKTLRSPGYGHPAHTEVATGYGPCRQCLKTFAVGSGRRLVAQRYVSNGVVEPELQQLLQDRNVAYIHVRDTEAGCYDFSIERMSDLEGGDESTTSNGGYSHE